MNFSRPAFNVRVGMLIKTLTGLELGGAVSSPSLESVPFLDAAARLQVGFRFRCLLTPGVYFLNAGVQGNVDGTIVYLDRRIDVLAFRVLPIRAMWPRLV